MSGIVGGRSNRVASAPLCRVQLRARKAKGAGSACHPWRRPRSTFKNLCATDLMATLHSDVLHHQAAAQPVPGATPQARGLDLDRQPQAAGRTRASRWKPSVDRKACLGPSVRLPKHSPPESEHPPIGPTPTKATTAHHHHQPPSRATAAA